MIFKTFYFIVFVLSLNATAQGIDTFTDQRDGQTYKTVKIGNRVWMAENLNYLTKRGSWCFENDTNNCNVYGRLYNWKTAQKVCPCGWDLPSYGDFYNLIRIVGARDSIGYIALKNIFNVLFSGRRHKSGNFYLDSDQFFGRNLNVIVIYMFCLFMIIDSLQM